MLKWLYSFHTFVKDGSFQGGVIVFRFSFRIMLGFWLLMMIVMVNLYGSTLTSYLTVAKLKPIPTSLEELADNIANQKCLLTIQKDHSALLTLQVKLDTYISPNASLKQR